MSRIILITFRDEEYFNGKVEMVSHGINEDTFENVVMSVEPLNYYINELKAKRDGSGEYYIQGDV